MTDPRPVVVYDGACRFCIEQARRLERLVGERVRLASFREPGVLERHPQLRRADCERALQLVEPDGSVRSGADAVVHALGLRAGFAPLRWLYGIPGLRQLFELGYGMVARNRFRLRGEVCAEDACRLHE
jgi:predicted DCC family thiol-disulfide oxidoreductase YuxK